LRIVVFEGQENWWVEGRTTGADIIARTYELVIDGRFQRCQIWLDGDEPQSVTVPVFNDCTFRYLYLDQSIGGTGGNINDDFTGTGGVLTQAGCVTTATAAATPATTREVPAVVNVWSSPYPLPSPSALAR